MPDAADDTTAPISLVEPPEQIRDLYAALVRVAPLYAETPAEGASWFLAHMIEISVALRDAAIQYVDALTELHEISTVFRSRKDTP